MKLLDILKEGTEYKVSYTVLKDKDFSKGSASYESGEDAKKFFDDMVKDDEVISATLRKKTGPDSSQDMMGGFMKSLGREEDIERYTHPAWKGAAQGGKKYDELTDQEKNIRSFLGNPSFISKKKGFTNKDGSDKYFEEGMEENKIGKLLGARNYKYVGGPTSGKAIVAGPMLDNEKNQLIKKARQAGYVAKPNMGGGVTIFIKEGISKSAIMRQIKDAEEILDSGEADGMPLDNETEMLVQQELTKLKRMLAMNETSLEEIYNQVSEAKDFGFFGNEEGKTGNAIASEAFDDYEAAVERAFQNLVNKVNTAINIGGSGGTDTEVREMMMYHFDKIQEKVTTTDLINATFRK